MIQQRHISRSILLLIIVLTSCQPRQHDAQVKELPAIKKAPEFTSINYDGSELSDTELNGNVYIAYFFFTSCGGPCPVMNSQANVLQSEYADAVDFRIVGFSVDPERDTVEELARYAERYSAVGGRWYMLRNDHDVVADLASKGFLMGDAGTPAMHSTRFALVDRAGNIRGYYDGTDSEAVDELRVSLNQLLGEDV